MLKENHILNDSSIKQKTENEIDAIIAKAQLDSQNNNFFKKAKLQKNINVSVAFNIAYNWREITKNFLFTAISGLGCLANKLGKQPDPDLQTLSILQNMYHIISDDLNNTHPLFKKMAPVGATGIHFKWWEMTILDPLKKLHRYEKASLSKGTQVLTRQMHRMAQHPFGVAVQLRIVETIALDISLAFYTIFSRVTHHEKKVFTQKRQLAWITSHIQAEKVHYQQVCDDLAGMAYIANTLEEQHELLLLTNEHANAWAEALNDFATFLK